MYKKIILCLLVLFLLGCASKEEPMDIQAASFINKVAPIYPTTALASNTEGYVLISYTVTPKGLVVAPKVTDSQPKDVFDAAALLAIYQFKYSPRIVNGNPTSISGMSYRFDFNINKYRELGLID